MTVQPDPWQRAIFGLVSPDAIRRHLMSRVLDYLRGAGLEPARWQVAQVTSRQVDEVAAIQRAGAGEAFRYRGLDALFALGPCIVLQLEDTAGRAPDDIYAAGKRVKGAIPQTSPEGTIRRDLGSINLIMSFLHLSDTPGNSAQESVAILGSSADDPGWWLPGGTLADYAAVLEATRPRESRGFTDVLEAVRGRIVAVLFGHLSPAGRAVVMELARQGQLAEPKAGKLIAAELTEPGAVHPLTEILCMSFEPGMPPADMSDVQQTLSLYRCSLDSWEYAVLATSMYFEPIRDSS